MLLAELHSKLAENSSNEEKMEDVLTSNIFGVLKYLDHPLILKKFLCTAETYDEKILNIEEAQKFEYYFWPKFANGVEPDILVQGFTKDGLFYNILVEVKYYSKKSNIEEEDFYRDQLAEEYKELLNEEWSDDTISTNASKSILLYATANYIKPQLEIEESLSVIEEELGQEKENIELYWVSLRWIYDLIQDYGYYYCEGNRKMLDDLSLLLKGKRLGFFPFKFELIGECFNVGKIFSIKEKEKGKEFNWEIKNLIKYPISIKGGKE